MVHCNERGSEMIVGDQSHMFYYEQGNAAWVGGIQSCQIPNNKDGTFDIQGVVERIRENDIHCPVTKLIAVENTHNRCGGRVMPIKWLDEVLHNKLLHCMTTFKLYFDNSWEHVPRKMGLLCIWMGPEVK